MRRHGFLAAMLLGVAAATTWMLNRQIDLDASEENGRSFREALTRTAANADPVADPNGLKLNYFDATWDRVLRNVAEQKDLTLIMDEIPPGRFARRDRTIYNLDSALRILNSELEPQGYRLLNQNGYLIVLNLDRARSEYARPRLGSNSAVPADSVSRSAASGSDNAEPLIKSSSPTRLRGAGLVRELETVRDTRSSSATTQNTVSESPARFGSQIAPVSQQSSNEIHEAEVAAEPQPLQKQAYQCSYTKAADLARTMYLVFEKRAELQRDGIQGLPSFAVFESRSDESSDIPASPLFRVGIDQSQNQLIIEAPAARLNALQSLLKQLDRPANASAETVKVLPNNGLSIETAKDLNEQIHQMVSMKAATTTAAAAGAGSRNLFAQDQTTDESQASGNLPSAGQELPQSQGESVNLRGEVNVQAMQELGILILKGNDADVAKVAEIIARLEQMSVGSLPDIHLLTLRHVNSEAMAVLMTSVYEQLSELRQRGSTTRKTAAFIPVVQPNAILILTSEIEKEGILDLADKLDQPLDPESEFQVFPLKNAIASQVVTALDTFYTDPTGLRTRPRAVADVRTNAIIVQGRINDLKEVAKLIERIDKDESGAVQRVQIFPLKNAVAEELSQTISNAIQAVTNPPQQLAGQAGGLAGFGAATQGAQELRASKSVALEFLTTDGNARQLIKSGILVDVRVNADTRTNSLIVSASEASMGLMSALIQALDLPPSATAEIKVFTLKNADASQSVTMLQTLFDNQNTQDQLGIQIAGTEGQPNSLVPLRFSADIRTNTVLAVGGAEALSVVEAILLRLDTSDVRQRTTEVIQMRNAPAELVAATLTSFLEQQAALQDSSEDLVSNIERLRQEVIVASDVNSNSLIVSASPQYYSQIARIIETLDATPPEVVIQALIVEVTLDETDEFGIELGFQDPLLLSRSLLTTPGLNFNNTNVGLGTNTTATDPGKVGTQGLSNFSLGRQNAELGFGGFVFSAQSDAVSVLLRALAARRTVHVLSRPQIRTTHNNQALVSVGQSVPIVNGVNVNQLGTANPNIEYRDTGITLTVTPRITPEGIIAMSVAADKSSLAPGGVPIFVDGATGNSIEAPIINQTIANTLVNVPNGQTIVIGGMITKSDTTLERKVPWLGDLPIVGKAFRYDGTSSNRTEMLIFLTPRIILNDLDSELIKQIESERLHFIESEAEEIHGPLYSVPPAGPQFDSPFMQYEMMPPSSGTPHQPGTQYQPSLPHQTRVDPATSVREQAGQSAPATKSTAAPVTSGIQPASAERLATGQSRTVRQAGATARSSATGQRRSIGNKVTGLEFTEEVTGQLKE